MLLPIVYLIQRPLSIFWVLHPLEMFLVIVQMQLVLLQRMVPPSNWVPQNHTSFGIMARMSSILGTSLYKCKNYISMLVYAISQLFVTEYIIS